jgi:hypothetical protein
MDPEALYEIHIDNDGDAREDLTFRFRFENQLAAGGEGIAVPAGDRSTKVPLINVGPISADDTSNLNLLETYTVKLIRGDRRNGDLRSVTHAATPATRFRKPTDYIGTKTFGGEAAYAAYARAHLHDVRVPGCAGTGRMFVGQRRESFAVNLGPIFDLVNAPPEIVVGGATREGRDLLPNPIGDKNVTTLALELPVSCVRGSGPVIAAWTTAHVRQVRVINPRARFDLPALEGGPWTQVSRLSTPLVNEVVIGLPDKDRFNGSHPRDDAQFAGYVTNPSLPELVEILFGSAGVMAPDTFPRADLVAAFLTGVPGVNANGSTAEMLRLNVDIPPTPMGAQNSLGAAACFVGGALVLSNPGCDPAGFPNGRRPGDDTVDIALRVVMGYLLPNAPSGQLPFTDAVLQEDAQFDAAFPYLRTPMPGAQ